MSSAGQCGRERQEGPDGVTTIISPPPDCGPNIDGNYEVGVGLVRTRAERSWYYGLSMHSDYVLGYGAGATDRFLLDFRVRCT